MFLTVINLKFEKSIYTSYEISNLYGYMLHLTIYEMDYKKNKYSIYCYILTRI